MLPFVLSLALWNGFLGAEPSLGPAGHAQWPCGVLLSDSISPIDLIPARAGIGETLWVRLENHWFATISSNWTDVKIYLSYSPDPMLDSEMKMKVLHHFQAKKEKLFRLSPQSGAYAGIPRRFKKLSLGIDMAKTLWFVKRIRQQEFKASI